MTLREFKQALNDATKHMSETAQIEARIMYPREHDPEAFVIKGFHTEGPQEIILVLDE